MFNCTRKPEVPNIFPVGESQGAGKKARSRKYINKTEIGTAKEAR